MLFHVSSRSALGRAAVIVLAVLSFALPVAAQQPADRLILSEQAYCRACYQIGWNWLDSKVLKAKGAGGLGGRELKRLEHRVKKRLAYRKLDWSKEDWRDHAVYRTITLSHRTTRSHELEHACRTETPPANWTAHDFDDSTWQRFIKPFAVGNETGVYFSQWSAGLPGLQAACLRYRFHVPDPGRSGDLVLNAEYVGGIRVFINGEEIGRGHLPRGKIERETPADGYPEEAYRSLFEEVAPKYQARVLQKLKGKKPPKYYGYAMWRVTPGSRLYKLRNRSLGPMTIPSAKLRAGVNVLAVEIRSAALNPRIALDHVWTHGFGQPRGWLHGALTTLELRSTGPAIPSGLQRPPGVQVWVEDLHRRVFSPEYLEPGAPIGTVRMVGARNGTYGAQIVVGTERELGAVTFTFTGLRGSRGNTLPAASLRAFGMARHPAKTAWAQLGEGRIGGNNFFTRVPGYRSLPQYASLVRYAHLVPKEDPWKHIQFYDQITRALPEKIPAGICQPFWIRVTVPNTAAPDIYRGQIRVNVPGAAAVTVPIEIEVVDWPLPAPSGFQAILAAEQSPYGVAKAYKTRLWSDEHFKYVEASVRELGRIGNDWWFVPVIRYSEFGNRTDSMIRWIRSANGSLSFDFTKLDRYLDMIVKHSGKPRVVSFVVMHGAPGPVEVTVFDEKTGQVEGVSLGGPKCDPGIRRDYWRAFAIALRAHMRGRGLLDAMHWGYAWDTEGDPKLKELLRGAVPDVQWTFGAHSRGAGGSGGKMARESLKYYRSISLIYGLVPGLRSRMGWKRENPFLLNPRMISSCSSTEGHAPPFNFRMMVDRSLVAGHNGMGRVGADYWNGSYYDGGRASAWHQASFSILTVLWPGAEGAEPSARYEAMLEGYQEAEARIFMEQAIDRGLLPEDTAKRVEHLLNEHNRETLHIPVHVSAHQLTEGARGWLDRSRRLYRAAAEVAATIGLDVEKTDFGGDDFVVPAFGKRRIALNIRNWARKERGWRAASSAPWLRLARTSGTVAVREALPVMLDGAALIAGTTATGTVTVTDAATGALRPVTIRARVIEPVGITAASRVLNIPIGAEDAKTLTVLNNTDREQDWRLRFSEGWLKAEPASGRVPPAASVPVRVTVRPPDREGAFRRVQLSMSAVGGKATTTLPLEVFVIPPHTPPGGLPAGDAVPLHKVHKDLVVSHRHMNWFRHKIDKGAAFGSTLSVWGSPRKEVKIGDKKYDMALWVLPYHETVYKLEGSGFKAFSAEVGLSWIVAAYAKGYATGHQDLRVCFEVHVDGKVAAHSGLMKSTDGPKLLVVEGLEKAKQLKLITRLHTMLYGDGSYAGEIAYSNWADPKLYR